MKALVKTLIPAPYRLQLRRIGAQVRHYGWARHCPVCHADVASFLSHGTPPETDAVCPVCRSKAPHRLAMFYFQQHQELFQPRGLLVHIAPEAELGRRLRIMATSRAMAYRAGGITGTGDTYLDLFNLPFKDNSVSLMYCCHVLNSLQDDRAAMREVFRVMHPMGTAVLQVPAFHEGPTTVETSSRDERLRTFQDEGIFRCYTDADYVARLNSIGFEVEHFRAAGQPANMVKRHGLKGEVLHTCRKPASSR